MIQKRRNLGFEVLLLAFILAGGAPLPAATISIGALGNASDGNYSAAPATIVDLAHGATADGSVTSATVFWSGGPCSNAFKIKFFRPVPGAVTFLGERGPFASS